MQCSTALESACSPCHTPRAGRQRRFDMLPVGAWGIAMQALGNANRGDSPCTFVNETSGINLVQAVIPQVVRFSGVAVLRLVKRGMYANTRAIRKNRFLT
ncbi:hypothetical protein B7486_15385 [cyanobacterium TDX16]|nr:hypothetical protein B7486_15385 [cyanobacterium TDX16]